MGTKDHGHILADLQPERALAWRRRARPERRIFAAGMVRRSLVWAIRQVTRPRSEDRSPAGQLPCARPRHRVPKHMPDRSALAWSCAVATSRDDGALVVPPAGRSSTPIDWRLGAAAG